MFDQIIIPLLLRQETTAISHGKNMYYIVRGPPMGTSNFLHESIEYSQAQSQTRDGINYRRPDANFCLIRKRGSKFCDRVCDYMLKNNYPQTKGSTIVIFQSF